MSQIQVKTLYQFLLFPPKFILTLIDRLRFCITLSPNQNNQSYTYAHRSISAAWSAWFYMQLEDTMNIVE
jgi:hypothetical protein